MLAIVYLAFMFWVGDTICRRFYCLVSVPHRLAAAFLVGVLVSSWFTYLTARVFASTTRPLLWGDLLFFVATTSAFVWVRLKKRAVGATLTGELASALVAPSAKPQIQEGSTPPAEEVAAPADETMMPEAEKISTSTVNADKMSALPAEGTWAPTANSEGRFTTTDEPSALPVDEASAPSAYACEPSALSAGISAPSVNADEKSALTDEESSVPPPSANAAETPALPAEETASAPRGLYLPRPAGSDRLDWVFIGAYFILACWLMFATLNSGEGKLQISGLVASDFGPNTSLVQSFAVGKNFPSQYPHFAGVKILIHFLFWFQAGNLEFLGLDPAWSINLLSIFSMVALLILTMVLGEVLFNSRAVGRVGSALFFFFGSLSYLPFLRKQESLGAALRAVTSLNSFLPSIYPYRGEAWGFYSQNIFINQRHISGAIGILLLVLIFLVLRYREVPLKKMNWRAWKAKFARPVVIKEPIDTEESEAVEAETDETPAFATEGEMQMDLTGAQASLLHVGEDEIGATAEDPDKMSALPASLVQAPSEMPSHEEDQISAVSTPEGEGDETSADADDIVADEEQDETSVAPPTPTADELPPPPAAPPQPFWPTVRGFIFSGALLGLLPMWNGAVFAAAFALLLGLFILLPLRRQMLALAASAGIFALPQVIYLSTGSARAPAPPLLHWGYLMSPAGCSFCLDDPTIWAAVKYLGFTVGFKWLLVALALILANRLQRRFFVAAFSLVVLTFLFQLSVEVGANHKFLHAWIIIVNLFVAYGLYRLWTMKTVPIAGRIAAIVFTGLIVTGGVIDLFPIHNANYGEADFRNDPLVNWVRTNTKGEAIFLSDRFPGHPILMAGRKIFFGWPYFPWSVGYDLGKREPIYKQMFESNDPSRVFRLLRENSIDYVAYDDGVRRADFLKKPNEQLYARYFQKVWEDKDHRYGNLVIYKVPDVAPAGQITAPEPGASQTPEPAVTMFEGGMGTGPGQFDSPRGIAIDRAGNFLIADTGNGRIQKFSPKGDFISSFGHTGTTEGEFRDPFGIAFDRNGNIYVLEAGNGRIQKFNPDGTFSALWRRTENELDMYGPRRIVIGPDDSLYVAGGYDRIVKFNLEGRQIGHWGGTGNGDGQFKDMTSVAVDPKEKKVYATDPGNKRIQIFDLNGNLLGKWPVEEWGTYWGFEDLAIDAQARRLYASSTTMDNILVFDLNNGNRLGTLQPKPPDKLESPTAIALSKGKLYVLNNRTARVSVIDLVETKK